jgi:uncharacterized protein (TIGR00369 family)
VTEHERAYRWHDPLPLLAQARGMTPPEYMRAVASGALPQPPIADTLGFRLVEAEGGVAVFTCEPQLWHYNPIGTVHAGLALTLLDSAMGCALVTTLEEPRRWTTLELKANFTRALDAATGEVRCTGSVLHPGRTVVTAEARLEDAAGRLCAHGTSTILMLDQVSRDGA